LQHALTAAIATVNCFSRTELASLNSSSPLIAADTWLSKSAI